ncbi:isochorismate synthase [[Actinomadura] parvosata]|uniref:isochorismate synthase n=1 Tax=[Actinomadura] parvosata TaxID=1955412 RepID=UPI00406D2750
MSPWLLPPKAPAVADYVAPPIKQYRRRDVLFSGLDYTLLARGGGVLTSSPLSELPSAAAAALAQHGGDHLIGAISFDGLTSRLTVPERVTRHGPLTARQCFRCGRGDWRIVPKPSEDDFIKTVRLARDRLAAGEADKVVLARALTLTTATARPIRLTDLLVHLGGRGRHTFAVPLGRGSTLVGASPELLISRHGRTVTTKPLAGSAPRQPDPVQDQETGRQLLASPKDGREHRLVVDSVAAALAPYCANVHIPQQPELQPTPTMWHLGTTITATLADPAITSLHLAAALHPTPAVCGTPTSAARALITELEGGSGIERGWYAGLVGWQDAAGDGEWAIALRCAVMDGPRRLRLWAGAGVVADSDPAAELAETNAKLATMLHALHAIPR